MDTERITDERGTWQVRTHPSGAQTRVLVEPSDEYKAEVAERAEESRQRRREDAQARLDEWHAFTDDLMDRLNGLPSAQREALEPVYDDMVQRKHAELRVAEAEALLNEDG